MTHKEMLSDLVDEFGAESVLRALRYEIDVAVGNAVSCASMTPVASAKEYENARAQARAVLAHLGECAALVKGLS